MKVIDGFEFAIDGHKGVWYYVPDKTWPGAVRRAKAMLMENEEIAEMRVIWKSLQ